MLYLSELHPQDQVGGDLVCARGGFRTPDLLGVDEMPYLLGHTCLVNLLLRSCAPTWVRTRDQLIKSQLLYH